MEGKDKKLLILIIHILMVTQTYFFLPLIPVYARQFGLRQVLIGQIIFFYNLPMGFAKIYIGYLVDRIGSKKVLIYTNFTFALAFIFYLNPASFVMLSIAQLLAGTCRAAFLAATSFYISEMDQNARGKNLGLRTAGTGIGFFIGPILGSLLTDAFGYHSLFYILLISLIFNIFIILKLPVVKKTVTLIKKSRGILHDVKELIDLNYFSVILSGFAMAIIVVVIDNYLPLYLDQINIPIRLAGFILSMKGFSQIFFAPFIGSLSDDYGRNKFIYSGLIITALSLFLLPKLSSFFPLMLTVFFISIGFTILNPILNALAAESVEYQFRGFSLGIFQSAVSFAKTIFAIIYGYLFAVFNLSWVFSFSAFFLFGSVVIVFYIRKSLN